MNLTENPKYYSKEESRDRYALAHGASEWYKRKKTSTDLRQQRDFYPDIYVENYFYVEVAFFSPGAMH